MIKFFRKIRYNLIEKNKTGKYFKYAIGEIILVVLGILIALQINNWNETKKESQYAIDNLNNLSKNYYELNTNSGEVYFLQIQDSVLQSLRRNDSSLFPTWARNYKNYPLSLSDDALFYWDDNIDFVISAEKSFPSDYNYVIEQVKFLKKINDILLLNYLEELKIIEAKNDDILSNSFDWYDDFNEVAVKKRNAYFRKDSLFQNRLFQFSRSFQAFASQAFRSRMLRSQIWLENENLKPNTTLNGLKAGLEEMSLEEMTSINCDYQEVENSMPSFRIWNLIYNATNDTTLIGYSQNQKLSIPPNRSIVVSNNKNNSISVYNDDNCVTKYLSIPRGFLIID